MIITGKKDLMNKIIKINKDFFNDCDDLFNEGPIINIKKICGSTPIERLMIINMKEELMNEIKHPIVVAHIQSAWW